MSSKQIVEPTEEINILLRRTAVPKCDITPAVKGLRALILWEQAYLAASVRLILAAPSHSTLSFD